MAWINEGSFKGPKGDTGATGATGAKGDKGDQGIPGPYNAHAVSHASGGSDPVTPASIRAVPVTQREPLGGVQTIPGANTSVVLDGSAGSYFYTNSSNNITVSTTNMVKGQRVILEVFPGAAITISFASEFVNLTSESWPISAVQSKRVLIGFIYVQGNSTPHVVAISKVP